MYTNKKNRLPYFGTAIAFLVLQGPLNAQEAAEQDAEADDAKGQIEEVVVTGRFISSSQQLVNERMNDAFATDLLGEDTIARLGDSTVGAALRRVPGISLVDDKYVYIHVLRPESSSISGKTLTRLPPTDGTLSGLVIDCSSR